MGEYAKMNEYEKLLHSLTVLELKQIIKRYISHVKITVTGKKKTELIKHIMWHTKLDKDNNIVTTPATTFVYDLNHLPNLPKKQISAGDEEYYTVDGFTSEKEKHEYKDGIPLHHQLRSLRNVIYNLTYRKKNKVLSRLINF